MDLKSVKYGELLRHALVARRVTCPHVTHTCVTRQTQFICVVVKINKCFICKLPGDGCETDERVSVRAPSNQYVTRERMQLLIATSCSVLSTAAIVLLNKWLFTYDNFSFPATLTGWHLLVTHAVLSCALSLGMFQKKALSWKAKIWFSTLDALAMALQNLSLKRNSVNFYQTCKLFTIPITVVLERLIGHSAVNVPPNFKRLVALLLITIGMALSTGANFDTNFVGVLVGFGATVATALVIVSTAWLQKLHSLSSTQLLYNVAIVDGIILTTLGPLLDYHISSRVLYTDYVWTLHSKCIFATSCAMAVCVNCVTFYLLGKISPLSYQVIGQVKTVTIYAIGYYFFDKRVSWRSNLGASLAMLGCVIYARLSLINERQRASDTKESRTGE